MVAQCADSTASSSPMENSPSLDIIIDDDHNHHHHQQQQPFVFGPNLMQMVSNLLLKAFDSGQFAVVEQLLCWQDAIDWSHTLCLLLNELRTTRHCMAAVALVRAVAQLLRMAPAAAADQHHTTSSSNSSRELQLLRNKIKVLRFDELMRSLRERFVSAAASDPSIEHHYLLLEEAIEDCLIHMTKTTPTTTADQQQRHGDETEAAEAVTRNSRTDADSGTFSGDEEEMKQQQMPLSDRDKKEEGGQQQQQHMANDEQQHQQQQQQHINEVIRLVHTLPAQEVPLLAKFLRTNRRSLGPLVSLINSSKHHQHQLQQHHLDNNNCQPSISQFEKRSAPPPPPAPPPAPQMLLSTIAAATSSPQRCPHPGAAATAFPPAAPPPPPPPPAPSSLVRPPPAPPLASPAAASVCRELNTNGSSSGQQLPAAEIPSALRPKALPDQCRRLRHLQWTKLPTNAVASAAAATTAAAAAPNCANVWQTMEAVDREMRDRLDFAVLDAFFGCSSNTPQNISSSSSDISHRSSPSWSTARRRSSMMMNGGGTCGDSVVSLLDAKRSLSVNVFLKMCRDSGQLLIDLAEGKADKIGADRLRTIAHLLPSADEQKLLRDFSGDKQVLGAAEQFLLALIERIPAHRLRVEAMLFKLDLQAMLDTNRPSDVGTLGLKVWLKGCQELLCSSTLRKVLYALLHLGNYLNHGAGAGNAVGFRLSSLWKVEDVKTIGGTTRGRTLLHFVAQQVDNCAQELAAELQSVREAAKSSLEAISDDVRSLSERMHCLEEGIARTKFAAAAPNSAGGDNFLDDFLHFLEKSRHIIASAERQLAELSTLRRQVAIFLCEQERTFSLEECFKVIAWFVTRFEKAVEDNRRFMERNLQQQQQQQQQLEMGNNQFRKSSPDNLDGMALKSVIKKRDRLSFALVDERERQQTPSCCPPSSPGKVRRRRTAHSVTPLLDARLFLNGLDESAVERTADGAAEMKKDGIIIEQSLEAVVDQALMRKEIVSARETKCTKIDEEKKGQQQEEKHMEMVAQQMANSTLQHEKLVLASQTMPTEEAKFSARQQHREQQNMPPKEENLLQNEAVPPSPALVTMSTKAKKHLLTDRNNTAETQQQQQRQRVKTNAQRTHGQTVPERVGGQQQQFGTNNNSRTTATAAMNVKPNASRVLPPAAAGVLRTAQKRTNNNLAPAPKCTANITADPSSAPKCAPAVCRIRIVAKPNSNNNNGHGIMTTTIEAGQHQQKRAQHQQQMCSSSSSSMPDRPLKPSQVKACQPKVQKPAAAHGGVGTLGQKATVTASAGPFKTDKNVTTIGGGCATATATAAVVAKMKPSSATPTSNNSNGSSTGSRRSVTTAATSTTVGSCQMMMMICRGQTPQCQEKQQQQKDCKTMAPAQPTQPQQQQQQQQQQQHLRATKPTLTRRLSTSSRPTLVHSTGRSCTTTAGSREREKPKWI